MSVVLGIDPGTSLCGYGVVELQAGQMRVVAAGTLDLHKIEDRYYRLGHLLQRLTHIINTFKPTEVALESAFYGKNVQSMLKLGRAQGVVMALSATHGLKVSEYSPAEIKKCITGQGGASKGQVARMLEAVLGCELDFPTPDASDGLAVAVCHCLSLSRPLLRPKAKKRQHGGSGASWGKFAKDNPDLIVNNEG